jgi:hypothetical protein
VRFSSWGYKGRGVAYIDSQIQRLSFCLTNPLYHAQSMPLLRLASGHRYIYRFCQLDEKLSDAFEVPERLAHKNDAHIIDEVQEFKVMGFGHGTTEQTTAKVVEKLPESHLDEWEDMD